MNYKIQKVIDEGGYGIVYKAYDKELGKHVAIKQFKEDCQDPIVKKALEREIKMLKQLKSNYVVQMLEAYKQDNKIYFAFQYISFNLLNLIQKYEKNMPIQLFKKLALQIAKGLWTMHSKNAMHRDIKPQNILVDENNNIKLCDFGFARYIADNNQNLTDYVATRWYRGPQLLVGSYYQTEVDIWAYGCILCQMLDGLPIFPGQNDIDQLNLIQSKLGPINQQQLIDLIKSGGMPYDGPVMLRYLQDNYQQRIGFQGVSLLKQCLKINPKQRITAKQIIEHPFFSKEEQLFLQTAYQKKGFLKKNCGIFYSQYKGNQVQKIYRSHKLLIKSKPNFDDIKLDLTPSKGKIQPTNLHTRLNLRHLNLYRNEMMSPMATFLVQRRKDELTLQWPVIPAIHSVKHSNNRINLKKNRIGRKHLSLNQERLSLILKK